MFYINSMKLSYSYSDNILQLIKKAQIQDAAICKHKYECSADSKC